MVNFASFTDKYNRIMIKLTNILTELLNTFEITAIIVSDKKESITDIETAESIKKYGYQ